MKAPLNILITSGGCRENIDAVRFITNFSTGSTGAFLADFFAEKGAKVHFLSSEGAIQPKKVGTETTFTSFLDLDEKLKVVLATQTIDVILHVAAVSDFSITRIEQGALSLTPVNDIKLMSDVGITIKMKPNFKIISQLKKYAKNGVPQVIGFKLTRNDDETERIAAVQKLFQNDEVNWVIHNDLNDINPGQDLHKGKIYAPQGSVCEFHTKQQMAEGIWKLL